MAENTAAGTDQTVSIRPDAQSEQTVAIQPTAASEQTVNIQPAAATEQTVAIQPAAATEQTVAIQPAAPIEQTVAIQVRDAGVAGPAEAPGEATADEIARLKAVGTARVAIRGKATVKAIEAAPIELRTPEAPTGFEELTSTWWCTVAKVHEALLSEEALDTVCEAFSAELRARWEYARTLHQEGYEVPEYLTERAPVAPLWPVPELPQPAKELAHAA